MTYEFVNADRCKKHLQDQILQLSAANSINYLTKCSGQTNSWVARNHKLVNIFDPSCLYGYDEQCEVDLTKSNLPTCQHPLGSLAKTQLAVKNIQYGTKEEKVAT